MSIDASNAYSVIPAINIPNMNYDEEKKDTSLLDFADEKAEEKEENKAGTTILLEDFAEYAQNFHDGSSKMSINEKDVKNSIGNRILRFLGFQSKDTLYTTEEGQQYIEDNGEIYINDIYKMSQAKYGGIKYANDGDSIYDSALNFSKAAISAVEKTYSKVYDSGSKKDCKLNNSELSHIPDLDQDILEQMDLDGDIDTLSAEEYASYLVATDGFVENSFLPYNTQFSKSRTDGIIDEENSKLARNLSNEKFKEYAQDIYNNHYKQD